MVTSREPILAFVSYKDLWGERPFSELVDLVKRFELRSLLLCLSEIMHRFEPGRWNDVAFQWDVGRRFYRPDDQLKLKRAMQETGSECVFSALQLLNLERLAIVFARSDGAGLKAFSDDEDAIVALGEMFLRMNDYCEPAGRLPTNLDAAPPEESREALSALLFRNGYFHQSEPPRQLIVRYHSLFCELAPERARLGQALFDVEKAVKMATGFSPALHMAVGFAVLAPWLRSDPYAQGTPLPVMDPETLLANTVLDQALARAAVGRYCLNIPQYRACLSPSIDIERPRFQYDVSIFRRYPLVELSPHEVLCLSSRFLAERYTSGIFWAIADSLDDDGKKRFFQEFGEIVQDYVQAVLLRAFGARFHHIRYGKGKGQEAGDGVVEYADSLFFFEVKSGRVRVDVAASGDLEAVKGELKGKLLTRAARQLAGVIADFEGSQFSVDGRSCTQFKRYWPVWVTLEGLPQGPLLREIYEDEIRSTGLYESPKVQPLQIISLEELERLEAVLEEGSALDELAPEKSSNPETLAMSWTNFLFKKKLGENPSRYLRKTWRKVTDEWKRLLFGKK